jgi:acetyl esterase
VEPIPEFGRLLSQLRPAPLDGRRPLDELRGGMDRALRKWAGEGPSVLAATDTTVDGPYRAVPVRLYEPYLTDRPVPVVVFCHGSGFVLGGLETHDALARRLALATSAIVVGVDYLLAPEHPFPAAVEEMYAVLDWVAAGGAGPRADRHRTALAGDSAGGAIAMGTALAARDRGGPVPAAQLLLYPVCGTATDTPSWQRYGQGYFLDVADMRWFWEQYLGAPGNADDPYAVPLAAQDVKGLPPTVLVGAGCDPLLDEGRELAARLRGADVEVSGFSWDGAIHGFMTMFEISPSAGVAVRAAGTVLRELAGWGDRGDR